MVKVVGFVGEASRCLQVLDCFARWFQVIVDKWWWSAEDDDVGSGVYWQNKQAVQWGRDSGCSVASVLIWDFVFPMESMVDGMDHGDCVLWLGKLLQWLQILSDTNRCSGQCKWIDRVDKILYTVLGFDQTNLIKL